MLEKKYSTELGPQPNGDTRNVNNGVYYYDIKTDKTSFGSGKLIIRK